MEILKKLKRFLNRKCEIRIDSPVMSTPGFKSYQIDTGFVIVFNQCEDPEDSNDLFIMIGLFLCSIHILIRFGGIDRHKTQNEFIEKNVDLFNELREKAINDFCDIDDAEMSFNAHLEMEQMKFISKGI